jgi:hypothetical protein
MHKKFHLQEQEIPEGYQIFSERCTVMGTGMRKEDAVSFCEGTGRQWLEFQPDPKNGHDPNAIIIWGCWNGWLGKRRKMVGYVDREEAAKIASLDLAHKVQPRLLKTYVGHDGYVEILYQVLGPIQFASAYKDCLKPSA